MIKNYTSEGRNTFDKIQKILSTHGAKSIMSDFDNNGKVTAISFLLEIDGRKLGYRLPARVENVEKILQKTDRWGYKKAITDVIREQAYKTAWANIRDWIAAQMALIETEQVKIEEVFLPYGITKDGRTFFEYHRDNQFLLPEGDK